MAKGGCLVAAALVACSWQQGRAGRALAAADPAAARVDRGTRRWPWLNRLRRKSGEGELAAAPDESPRTRRALTACDAGSFWSLATATCEVCGSGEYSASGAAACTRCGDLATNSKITRGPRKAGRSTLARVAPQTSRTRT